MAQATHNDQAPRITKVYTRTYSDNGQTTTYVEWSNGSRTECPAAKCHHNEHMQALLRRASREGVLHTSETW